MSYSTQRVTSDGTLETLAISIEYFDRSEISILTDGIITPTGWEWVGTTDKTIHFTAPVPDGVEITVLRTTDLSEIRHQFSLGAAFKATTVDEDFTQILHIAQEARENASIADVYQNLNMHGYKIQNAGVGTEPLDLVNHSQLEANTTIIEGYVQDASDFADASEASAIRSEAAAEAAEAVGDVATQVHAASEKTTFADNDEIGGTNSATSFSLIRWKWSSLVTAVTSALSTVYATFAQGAKADTALQPAAIGTTVLAYVAPGTSGNVLTSNGTAWASAAPAGGDAHGAAVFTSSGTWVVPVGVTSVTVTCVGGGGGGGDRSSSRDGGQGGHGGCCKGYIYGLTPNTSISVTVGAGGNGNSLRGNGYSGGTSSFGSYLSCTGGTFGYYGDANYYVGADGIDGTYSITSGTALEGKPELIGGIRPGGSGVSAIAYSHTGEYKAGSGGVGGDESANSAPSGGVSGKVVIEW